MYNHPILLNETRYDGYQIYFSAIIIYQHIETIFRAVHYLNVYVFCRAMTPLL